MKNYKLWLNGLTMSIDMIRIIEQHTRHIDKRSDLERFIENVTKGSDRK